MIRKPAHQVTAGEGCSKLNDSDPCSGLALFKENINAFDFARFTLPESSIVQASVHRGAQFQHRMLPVPDHPPYSEMIYRAMHALKEGEGSTTKASISSYIKSHYHDLPWAHESFLSHHLAKQTDKCTIAITANGCYVFCTPTSSPKKRRKKQKQCKMPLAPGASVRAQAILSVKPLKTVTEKGLPTLQGPLGKPLKRRGRPLKSTATIEAKMDLEREQEEAKKRIGRPPKTKKMEAKKTEKDSEEATEKRGRKLGDDDDQEKEVVVEENTVFYGPKKRRGRPPRAKLKEDNANQAH